LDPPVSLADYQMSYSSLFINKTYYNPPTFAKPACRQTVLLWVKWARMDSNHRTPKRTDLQSVVVGHLTTCPAKSHLPESNWRPTDYKSVALPAELRWLILPNPPNCWPQRKTISAQVLTPADNAIKNYPQKFGKAKVMEFDKYKNFGTRFFIYFHYVMHSLSTFSKLFYSWILRNKIEPYLNSFFLPHLS
jgi:hypothetical protein